MRNDCERMYRIVGSVVLSFTCFMSLIIISRRFVTCAFYIVVRDTIECEVWVGWAELVSHRETLSSYSVIVSPSVRRCRTRITIQRRRWCNGYCLESDSKLQIAWRSFNRFLLLLRANFGFAIISFGSNRIHSNRIERKHRNKFKSQQSNVASVCMCVYNDAFVLRAVRNESRRNAVPICTQTTKTEERENVR